MPDMLGFVRAVNPEKGRVGQRFVAIVAVAQAIEQSFDILFRDDFEAQEQADNAGFAIGVRECRVEYLNDVADRRARLAGLDLHVDRIDRLQEESRVDELLVAAAEFVVGNLNQMMLTLRVTALGNGASKEGRHIPCEIVPGGGQRLRRAMRPPIEQRSLDVREDVSFLGLTHKMPGPENDFGMVVAVFRFGDQIAPSVDSMLT